MMECMAVLGGAMMWGMGAIGVLALSTLVLAAAAFAKYEFVR